MTKDIHTIDQGKYTILKLRISCTFLGIDHGRIKSLAGHTVYAYSSGLRAVQFLLRNYATRVDKKGIAPEQGFILLVI